MGRLSGDPRRQHHAAAERQHQRGQAARADRDRRFSTDDKLGDEHQSEHDRQQQRGGDRPAQRHFAQCGGAFLVLPIVQRRCEPQRIGDAARELRNGIMFGAEARHEGRIGQRRLLNRSGRAPPASGMVARPRATSYSVAS